MRQVFIRIAFVALAVAAVASPCAAQAHHPRFGMAFAEAQAMYPAARARLADGHKMLEITDVEFAQARWQAVDFIFDAAGRLDRVRLSTTAETYDHLRSRLREQYDAFASLSFASDGSATAADEMQIKICDTGAGGVNLTYEKVQDAV